MTGEKGRIDRLAPRVARLEVVPVGDVVLVHPPAEKDQPVVAQRVEVHQARIEALEEAADRLDLAEIAADPVGRIGDGAPGGEQILGLPILGAGAGTQQLIVGERVLPSAVLGLEVGENAPQERQGALRFFEGEDARLGQGTSIV